jgi:hypothetical protein
MEIPIDITATDASIRITIALNGYFICIKIT